MATSRMVLVDDPTDETDVSQIDKRPERVPCLYCCPAACRDCKKVGCQDRLAGVTHAG